MFNSNNNKDTDKDNEEIIRETYNIPTYLKEIYHWAYINPKNIKRLDNMFLYNLILFGNGYKLMKQYLKEISIGNNVLQVAHVYGNLITKMATSVGSTGHLDVIDIVPAQLEQARKKLLNFNNVEIWQQDATTMFHRVYDVIGIYFLLHEVPDKVKSQILNNALFSLEQHGGKIVIIDYHEPRMFHPVRSILLLVNLFLEPFADSLWNYDIRDFAKNTNKFNWSTETFFGGVYQKVVITKK